MNIKGNGRAVNGLERIIKGIRKQAGGLSVQILNGMRVIAEREPGWDIKKGGGEQ